MYKNSFLSAIVQPCLRVFKTFNLEHRTEISQMFNRISCNTSFLYGSASLTTSPFATSFVEDAMI